MRRRTKGSALVAAGAVLALTLGTTLPARAEAKIEPKAEQYLKQACTSLAGLKAFSCRVDETIEDIDNNGQKLQFSNRRNLSVSRPNRLKGESSGDTANRVFYYDGKRVTLFDKVNKVYGTLKVPGTIDEMLDEMHARFGYSQHLADFLVADPYRGLTENIESGTYIGTGSVRGVPCHHLAFRQSAVDWQLWVTAGDHPLPRKFVITYKRESGQPEYSATFERWDTNPKVTDADFEFKPPEGARKADFVEVREAAKQKSPGK